MLLNVTSKSMITLIRNENEKWYIYLQQPNHRLNGKTLQLLKILGGFDVICNCQMLSLPVTWFICLSAQSGWFVEVNMIFRNFAETTLIINVKVVILSA